MLNTMREFKSLDKEDSLFVMLQCIETIEKNFQLDEKICNGEYQILCYHLDGLYHDVQKEYKKELARKKQELEFRQEWGIFHEYKIH